MAPRISDSSNVKMEERGGTAFWKTTFRDSHTTNMVFLFRAFSVNSPGYVWWRSVSEILGGTLWAFAKGKYSTNNRVIQTMEEGKEHLRRMKKLYHGCATVWARMGKGGQTDGRSEAIWFIKEKKKKKLCKRIRGDKSDNQSPYHLDSMEV